MGKTYLVKRRVGRHVKDIKVQLPKPPSEYAVGEELTIQIEGRDVPVHVEIDCVGGYDSVLYIA
jgi:hypothetical protein